MRSQKRNQAERAFSRGYQAGVMGRSRSCCPHETSEARQHWLTGWREGREGHWAGFNALTHVQKLSNLRTEHEYKAIA